MLLRTVTVGLVVGVTAAICQADVVEYNTEDRDQWFTDVGGTESVSTVDFTGYDDLTVIDDQWAYLGVHFSGVVVASGPGCLAYPEDCWGIEGYPDINMTFDEPMNWIAADFPGAMFIELFRDGDLIYTTPDEFGGSGAGFFGGLYSRESFDSARIYHPLAHFRSIDDLHFGPVISVPSPGALALVGMVLVSRRRRCRDSS